jgi:hypothetical protein
MIGISLRMQWPLTSQSHVEETEWTIFKKPESLPLRPNVKVQLLFTVSELLEGFFAGLPDGIFSNQKSQKFGSNLEGPEMLVHFMDNLVHFTAIWNILLSLGIFSKFWYVVPRKIWQPCFTETWPSTRGGFVEILIEIYRKKYGLFFLGEYGQSLLQILHYKVQHKFLG